MVLSGMDNAIINIANALSIAEKEDFEVEYIRIMKKDLISKVNKIL